MITISAGLKATLAKSTASIATCWKVTLTNGRVLGFTDCDHDLVVSAITYASTASYRRTDVASRCDLSVDNLEVAGPMELPSIIESDLHAGLWDYAEVELFIVNWADLTQGIGIMRHGWLGEVQANGSSFTAELRGMTQKYATVIGELTSPSCRNNLGDARCQVDLLGGSPILTTTGTVTGVAADNQTFYDVGRTEAGPTGGVAILLVSHSNPGIVTLANPLPLPDGAPITISGAAGMTAINNVTLYRNPSGNTFELGVDTTSYPVYTTGGIATPLGGDSGYFDFGVVTFTGPTGCLNIGLSMEVRSYVPGQITLQLGMPYLIQIGDMYTISPGCDKSLSTCHDRFNNVVHFRGEPYLPGLDKLMQVGKQ